MNILFDSGFGTSTGAIAVVLVILKVTLVLLAAFAATTLMRRSPAGTRHVVWMAVLVSALALPLWSAWSPVPVRVLPAVAAPPAVATHPDRIRAQPRAAAPVEPAPASVAAPSPAPHVARQPIRIGTVLLGLWALGALVLLGRLALGAWLVRRIVRHARVLEQKDWKEPLYEIADRLGLDQAPRLVETDRVWMPFATGFLSAVIVVPAESADWSTERRSAVLIHELAHVRRRDLIGHVVSRVACALYWFHPLVWSASRHLRAESERACDDLALVLGTRPTEYAEHLLDIVTGVRDHRMPAVALAMAKPSEFEGRMLAILDPRRPRRGPGRGQIAWLAGSLAAVALVVGALSPARPMAAAPERPMAGTPPAPESPTSAADTRGASDSRDVQKTWVAAKTQTTRKTQSTQKTQKTSHPIEKDGDGSDETTNDGNAAQRVQVLAKSLRTDSNAEVRRVAAWGLERFASDPAASAALVDAVNKEQNEEVREMATWALADGRGSAAVEALNNAMLHDKSPKVRETAAWAVGEIGSPSSVEGLTTLLTNADPDVREIAAWSIGSCSPDRAPAALIKALSDPNREVRLSTAWSLHTIGDASAADELEAAFQREKDPEVQRGLIRALGSMGDKAVATLTRLVNSPDPEIRTIAVTALAGGNAGGPWPWPRPEPRPYP